ncbi:MAG: M3 family oligoendopeptidase [Candidatus Shapirobacteria bacterium]
MNDKDSKKWNLDDVLPMSQFDNFYQEIERNIEEIDKWWNKLGPEMEKKDFGELIEFTENLGEKITRIVDLPYLMEAADEKDKTAKLLKTKANDLAIKCQEKTRKINHWLRGLEVEGKKRLDDKNAKRLFAAITDLEYGLSRMREAAKHTLSQKEENVVTNKDVNGIETLKDLREIIEAEFEYELKIEGKEIRVIKTQSELLALTHSVDKEERKAAYEALLKKQKDNLDKLFLVYQAAVKDWGYEAKIRGFKSPITVRNFANDIEDKAVETMMAVCQEKKEIFLKYFEWKAKKLGVKKLTRFDLYAPIETKTNQVMSYEKAKELVLSTLDEFSADFKRLAEKVIEEKHVDVEPRVNKRSGAFCATIGPKITPYILLNHTGTIRDVYTLAHELGHAVHSLLANKHWPSVQQANLPLAETASTLAEMVLFEKILEKEKDKKTKTAMVSQKIDDTYATTLRQIYFVLFEMRAHEEIKKGITDEGLAKIWLEMLSEQLGKSVEVDPLFAYEWGYVSHIVESPFYCYAYAFGELLTISLYGRYKKEGKGFLPKIEKLLAAGGSKSPNTILKEAGVNINQRAFWEEGFGIIENWIKLLDN